MGFSLWLFRSIMNPSRPNSSLPGESLQFQVQFENQAHVAFLSRTAWRAACHAMTRPLEPASCLATDWKRHQQLIEEAVLRRLAAGARTPVVLRADDFVASPAASFWGMKKEGLDAHQNPG